MKILVVEKGFHGVGPMLELLDEGLITNVQFLMHSEKSVKTDYEKYCKMRRSDPYDEDNATRYISPWMDAWRKKNSNTKIN